MATAAFVTSPRDAFRAWHEIVESTTPPDYQVQMPAQQQYLPEVFRNADGNGILSNRTGSDVHPCLFRIDASDQRFRSISEVATKVIFEVCEEYLRRPILDGTNETLDSIDTPSPDGIELNLLFTPAMIPDFISSPEVRQVERFPLFEDERISQDVPGVLIPLEKLQAIAARCLELFERDMDKCRDLFFQEDLSQRAINIIQIYFNPEAQCFSWLIDTNAAPSGGSPAFGRPVSLANHWIQAIAGEALRRLMNRGVDADLTQSLIESARQRNLFANLDSRLAGTSPLWNIPSKERPVVENLIQTKLEFLSPQEKAAGEKLGEEMSDQFLSGFEAAVAEAIKQKKTMR
jgi:hypothetical protein